MKKPNKLAKNQYWCYIDSSCGFLYEDKWNFTCDFGSYDAANKYALEVGNNFLSETDFIILIEDYTGKIWKYNINIELEPTYNVELIQD